MTVLAMSQRYRLRPSTLLEIDCAYTAYCFDEACTYIMSKMDNKETPSFKVKYESFSALYKTYKKGG